MSRKHRIILLLFFPVLQNCGLFKKTTTETVTDKYDSRVRGQSKLDATHYARTGQHFFEWITDAASNDQLIRIQPKGKFTFAPDKGFEGEAEWIVIKSGTRKSGTALKLKDSLATISDQVKSENRLQKTAQSRKDRLVKTSAPAFWLIAGLILLAIALLSGVLFLKNR